MLYLLKFQLTRSRGAWHREYQEKRIDRNNFNSHAHVERDFFILLACKPFCISTHTLTWSVTDLPPRKIRLRLFQLTRSRGAWRHERKKRHDTRYFNSHAHVERDFGVQVSLICMNYFNSHAHVERDMGRDYRVLICEFQLTRSRGAWRCQALLRTSNALFQLTRSRGAWPRLSVLSWPWSKFQLTRSRGAWRFCHWLDKSLLHFNSHAHVERDTAFLASMILSHYFNSHAHVERDKFNLQEWLEFHISTHTLTWSVTGGLIMLNKKITISTHTLTWSVTVLSPFL